MEYGFFEYSCSCCVDVFCFLVCFQMDLKLILMTTLLGVFYYCNAQKGKISMEQFYETMLFCYMT